VSQSTVLVFSFIGMNNQEITVNGQSIINVKLTESAIGLDEMVLTGYGTTKKKDLTSSVEIMSAEKIMNKPVANFAETMAGQMAGVQVQQTDGAPGGESLSIRIRGTNSISQTNDPLYVVDGFPMTVSAFKLINTYDIESIQVLKDASATAIYGSRGANGVVLITTKKGKSGAPKISLNTNWGIQQAAKKIKMMNRDQFVSWYNDVQDNQWMVTAHNPLLDPSGAPHLATDPNSRRLLYGALTVVPDGTGAWKYNFRDPASVATMPDTDWQDELFRKAMVQNYNVSVSGGTDKTKYYVTGGYVNQEGIILNSDYKRVNLKMDLSTKISDRLSFGTTLYTYKTDGNEQLSGRPSGTNRVMGNISPLMWGLFLPPIFPLQNPDGKYGDFSANPEILGVNEGFNPVGMALNTNLVRETYGWRGMGFAEVKIATDLVYKFTLGGGMDDNMLNSVKGSRYGNVLPAIIAASNDRTTQRNLLLENILTYNKTIAEKHSFVAMAGYTMEKNKVQYMYGGANSMPSDYVVTLNAGTNPYVNQTLSESALLSMLGRVNYSFNDRYFVTASVRRDGSSRFGANNRWGTFPAASVAWKLINEPFMKGLRQVNDLKIRGGWGKTGNNNVGNYSSVGSMGILYTPVNGVMVQAANPTSLSNPNMTWEKVDQTNIGLDLGLFNSRIYLTADFYISKSTGLLFNVPVPTITGFNSQYQNIGSMQNKGMEFALTTVNKEGVFNWTSDFNISFNRNKVLALGADNRPIMTGVGNNVLTPFITRVGSPVATFYGFVRDGLFMTAEDLANAPKQSQVVRLGDAKYKDVNGDGIISELDQTTIGNNQPKFTAGFNNNFSYKNFGLDVHLVGSYGAKVYALFERELARFGGVRNVVVSQVDRYKSPEEPGDGIQRKSYRSAPAAFDNRPNSQWVHDASFLRIRNVNLSYTFRGEWMDISEKLTT
jgi:TonB-linked SusC/RagA family outer membrane protein